jgi:hypothetical protein
MSDQNAAPPGPGSWRDQRRAERAARRAGRREAWGGFGIGGLVLIVVGVVFLLRNFGLPLPENWWSVFLFIPGIGLLFGAWTVYQRDHAASPAALAMGGAGTGLIVLGIGFLLGADVGKFWPVILIAVGIVVLVGGSRRR